MCPHSHRCALIVVMASKLTVPLNLPPSNAVMHVASRVGRLGTTETQVIQNPKQSFKKTISNSVLCKTKRSIPMAEIGSSSSSKLKPSFAYTVVYVRDVAKSVEFYANAFGYSIRRLDQFHRWGELESGKTTIAFTPAHQHETDDITGVVKAPSANGETSPVQVCFAYEDVDAAYKRAEENGAIPVGKPEDKKWGQRVGYVRDIDGLVVRMESYR